MAKPRPDLGRGLLAETTGAAVRALLGDQDQAVVLGEVHEVLHVPRDQRQALAQAAAAIQMSFSETGAPRACVEAASRPQIRETSSVESITGRWPSHASRAPR
jgi:hypothetical protein